MNKTQIDEAIRLNTGCSLASYSIAERTADENLALDKAWSIIFKAVKNWQYDDSNHTSDYPFVETDLVANQKDYAFTTDEQGNLILDIFRVMIKNSSGVYVEIQPVDMRDDSNTETYWDGNDTAGIPVTYSKTGNGIILNCPPNYSWRIATELERGLKIFINREGSYFTTSDTTKKPGFAGSFHEYVSLRPSYYYAFRKGLKNKNDLKNEMLEMEASIKNHYSSRERDDEPSRITAEEINSI